jgi:dipeptide transport system permease protein
MTDTAAGNIQNLDTRQGGRIALFKEFWSYFTENRGAVMGLIFFITIVLIAIFADVIAPHAPNQQYRDAFLQPPFWQEGGSTEFILGTDAVGRDILSRLIHGSRYSLFIGCIVVSIALSVGILLGVTAGYFRGWLDTLIMRLMDIFLAFPSLLLALVLVAILGPSLTNAMIAIAIVQQPHYVRLTRAAVMGEMSRDYVTAARVTADVRDGAAQLPGADHRAGALSFSTAILDVPPRSAFSGWARSRPPRNGAPCWPRRANSSCAPGGW